MRFSCPQATFHLPCILTLCKTTKSWDLSGWFSGEGLMALTLPPMRGGHCYILNGPLCLAVAPSDLSLVTFLVAWSNTWHEAAGGYLIYSLRVSVGWRGVKRPLWAAGVQLKGAASLIGFLQWSTFSREEKVVPPSKTAPARDCLHWVFRGHTTSKPSYGLHTPASVVVDGP